MGPRLRPCLDARHRRPQRERLHPRGEDRPRTGEPGKLSGRADPAGRPLVFAFLDSWHRDPEIGSGTTVAISGLARGLRALGHRVMTVGTPPLPRLPGLGPGSAAARLAYNVRLRSLPEAARYADVVVGFDMDGFLLGRGSDEPPRVAALKGVALDEARFERGLPGLGLRLSALLERRSVRTADLVVVPSAYSARKAVEGYGIPPTGVEVVPEGIDLDEWESPPGAVRANRGPPLVLTVGRQYPRKNARTLLDALPLLRERVPGARVRVVGGGPEVPALRRRAERLGVAGAVEFAGPLPPVRVREAYRDADAFCLPSLQEGFGIVFLEAMASGTPVVGPRAGAVPEVVRDGVDGELVDPLDPVALAGALARVLTDRERARRTVESARERVRDFARERVCRRFVEAVLPLLGGGNGGSPPLRAGARIS